MPDLNPTEQKILARYVAAMDRGLSPLDALSDTIASLVSEAKSLGWPEDTVRKMPAVVTQFLARVSAEILRDVLEDVAAEVLVEETEQFLTTTTEGK